MYGLQIADTDQLDQLFFLIVSQRDFRRDLAAHGIPDIEDIFLREEEAVFQGFHSVLIGGRKILQMSDSRADTDIQIE